ncbi:hypothetical protein CY35_10G077400 [Sphagnum magellanicum]|nr:hypothetical protein CY35_10G077400 [Sphagnum magellanicum]
MRTSFLGFLASSFFEPGSERGETIPDFSSCAHYANHGKKKSIRVLQRWSLHHWRWKKKRKGLEDKKKSLEDKTKKKKKQQQQQQQQILNGRRAALEQDVAQLQTQLQNEKTLRMGLERALEEASDPTTLSSQPSVTPELAHHSQELITEILALQNEVSHLEQHVLSLYRKVLDQRLLSSQQQQYRGTTTVMTDKLRLSSSSSSEAQEPLPPLPLPPASPSTTIVSVQSSYRVSRFKVEQRQQTQCQTSSSLPLVQQQQQQQRQQCRGSSSSVAATTQGFKRPHSAIGAAGQSKTRYGSFLSTSFHCIDEEPNMGVQSHVSSASSPGCQMLQSQASPKLRMKTNPKPAGSSSSTSHVKVDTKLGTAKKASPDIVVIGLDPSSSRTPNALSEELLCCMAAIYCKLADPPLPTELSNSFSPSYSSSSSSATAATTMTTMHESSSREFCNSNESWSSTRWRSDNHNTSPSCDMDGCIFPDPYSVNETGDDNDVGPYSSMVEVPWICVDKERLAYAARALRNFRLMVEQLEKVDPGKMTQDEKLAFWINIYNALMMHAYLAYGIPRNRLKRLSLLQKAAYKVGLYSISAQTIEHSILGFRSNRPAQWLQALLNPGTKFKLGDERWAYALQTPEPSVCFALCCGGWFVCIQQRMCAWSLRLLSVSSCKPVLGSVVIARYYCPKYWIGIHGS